MIMTTHEKIAENVQSPVSPISWGCKKIQKVVVSTLSAEATSLNSTLDQLSWLRLYWAWILDTNTKWKEPKTTLSELPKTITTATNRTSDITVTDCKSLFDLVSRTAIPNCQEIPHSAFGAINQRSPFWRCLYPMGSQWSSIGRRTDQGDGDQFFETDFEERILCASRRRQDSQRSCNSSKFESSGYKIQQKKKILILWSVKWIPIQPSETTW